MKRNYNFDLLRIISMVLVIIIHISNIYLRGSDVNSSNYIIALVFNCFSRICVPVFFMISGALLVGEEYNKKKYFKRIFKFLLILVVWSIIYYLLKDKPGDLLKTTVNSLFNAEMTSRHLWFMYAIIALYIALPFIQSMAKNMNKELENLFIILWVLFNGFTMIYMPIFKSVINVNVEMPIPIVQGTYYLGYFLLGHILYKRINSKEIKRSNKYLWYFILCTLITIVVTCIESRYFGKHTDNMLWYRSIFTMIASSSVFIYAITSKREYKNTKLLLNISTISFGIYLVHVVFLKMIQNHITILDQNALLFIPISTIVIVLLSTIVCEIIIRIPYLKNLIR